MGRSWLSLGDVAAFVGANLSCATLPAPLVLSCEIFGVGFKLTIMNLDRMEFISWMNRIIQRFDLLDELVKTKTTRLEGVDGEELLDNQDILLLLKISPRTLQRYRSNGMLAYYRISGKIYYKRSDVEQLVKDSYAKSVAERRKKKAS